MLEEQIRDVLQLGNELDELVRIVSSQNNLDKIPDIERTVRYLLSKYSADSTTITTVQHKYQFRDHYFKYCELKTGNPSKGGAKLSPKVRQLGKQLLSDKTYGVIIPDLDINRAGPDVYEI